MIENCEVSVTCITYNQADYIRDMLDSILSQQTDFAFEIIVHDDASTDGTVRILEEYQNKYPEVVRLVIERENQFSKGIDFFPDMVNKIVKGRYIACCEGDDYWLDKDKLQRQWEALEEHPACDMCACRTVMVTEDKTHTLGEIRPRTGDGVLSMEEVILGGGGYLATVGLFFRKSMYDHRMAFEKVRGLDYAMQMKGALRGGIYYIDRVMAAYRRYAKNSQTVLLTSQENVMRNQCEQEKQILRTLDEETGGKFHATIAARLSDYESSFYDQLMMNREAIDQALSGLPGKRYMWGLGLRGRELERFCSETGIELAGVCDITNREIGSKTVYGNSIVHTDEALKTADVILASVTVAYDALMDRGYGGVILNMQNYMPRA